MGYEGGCDVDNRWTSFKWHFGSEFFFGRWACEGIGVSVPMAKCLALAGRLQQLRRGQMEEVINLFEVD